MGAAESPLGAGLHGPREPLLEGASDSVLTAVVQGTQLASLHLRHWFLFFSAAVVSVLVAAAKTSSLQGTPTGQLSEIWKKTWLHNANLRFHHSFPRRFEYCNVGFSTHSIVRKKSFGHKPKPMGSAGEPKNFPAIYGCSSFPFMAFFVRLAWRTIPQILCGKHRP